MEANGPQGQLAEILGRLHLMESNVKLEEWVGRDSHRILTLRHDESFEAQNEGDAQKEQRDKKKL